MRAPVDLSGSARFRVLAASEDPALWESIERLTCAVLEGTVTSHAADVDDGPGQRRLHMRVARFRAEDGGDLTIVVVVGAPAAEYPERDELRHRFGLTGRESEVALLLAQRHSNAEIARQLAVSPHTASRHTERILKKLAVRSRREVADAILNGRGAHC